LIIRILCLLFLSVFLLPCKSFSKENFKELIKNNISKEIYSTDSEAGAIVLFEKTSIRISSGNTGWTQTENVHRIIRILKADELDQANVTVSVPKLDYKNFVHDVKGITFSLVNGEIEEAAISTREDLLKKKVSDDESEVNFSLPGVKAGCIIEYSYEVVSEVRDWFYTWDMQEDLPKLVSEFEIIFPPEFDFTSIAHVRVALKECRTIRQAEADTRAYGHATDKLIDGAENVNESFWIRRNIPALAHEPFVVNMKNQMEHLDVQCTGYKTERFNNSWAKFNEEQWKKGNMRKEVMAQNKFLDATVDSLVKKCATDNDKARAIFRYVRAGFTGNYKKSLKFKKSLSSVFEDRQGNYAEINMLLAAMLVHAGLPANPVMLGTTEKLSSLPVMPVYDRLNRLVVAVKIDSGTVFLDATDKSNPYGMLDPSCYNGFCWVLGDEGHGATLSPSMIAERLVAVVKINGFTDTTAKMEVVIKNGMITSAELRRMWRMHPEEEDKYFAEFSSSVPGNVTVLKSVADNLNDPDTNLVIRHTCELHFGGGAGGMYVSSQMVKFISENPFKASKRTLPIEFQYRNQYSLFASIELPANLAPDTLPKPVKISYEDGALTYKKAENYIESMNLLSVSASLERAAINFHADEQDGLRTFFGRVIEESNEELILKKK